MKRFDRVKEILDEAVGGDSFGAHGAFWRGLTREQFVARKVFGRQLLVPGDAQNSNLVRAIEGREPFGSDIGTAGALFRRMPAGRDPVPAAGILFIRGWIADGCPDDEVVTGPPPAVDVDLEPHPELPVDSHLAFWRAFDNWAMFESTPEVEAAIGSFFGAVEVWMSVARGSQPVANWEAALGSEEVQAAIGLLAEQQVKAFTSHFGSPLRVSQMLDSFTLFGSNTLPDDPLRPQDPRHNMNGPVMWFVWSAFVDACLRGGTEIVAWRWLGRSLVLGLICDGLFRQRFQVTGFTADEAGVAAARDFVTNLSDADVAPELSKRFVESGLSGG